MVVMYIGIKHLLKMLASISSINFKISDAMIKKLSNLFQMRKPSGGVTGILANPATCAKGYYLCI